jgi:hypothetical protein
LRSRFTRRHQKDFAVALSGQVLSGLGRSVGRHHVKVITSVTSVN